MSKWILSVILSPVRKLLREAKVGQADVSFTVQQDVLGLQVAVDDFFGVEVLDGTHDLRSIEEPRGVAETPTAAEVTEQFTARHVVHQHVEEALIMVSPEPESQQTRYTGGIRCRCFNLEAIVIHAEHRVIASSVSHRCPTCPLEATSVKALPDELRKSDKMRGCISLRFFYPLVQFGRVCNNYFSWKGTSEE